MLKRRHNRPAWRDRNEIRYLDYISALSRQFINIIIVEMDF